MQLRPFDPRVVDPPHGLGVVVQLFPRLSRVVDPPQGLGVVVRLFPYMSRVVDPPHGLGVVVQLFTCASAEGTFTNPSTETAKSNATSAVVRFMRAPDVGNVDKDVNNPDTTRLRDRLRCNCPASTAECCSG